MHWIDPLYDRRWADFVERHQDASVFHTTSWLDCLRRTYGYRPIVLTSCPGEVELTAGIPFCEVKSWISGFRLVSVPFSDHCQPLLRHLTEFTNFISYLQEASARSGWDYIEFRPLMGTGHLLNNFIRNGAQGESMNHRTPIFASHREYQFHKIDLRPDLNTIFKNLHKDCVRRKIRRAERENLQYEAGRSDSNLEAFYRLLLITRRRHRLPPQPVAWFRNLRDCFGSKFTILTASKNGRPIASILTLAHKNTLYYKYGCSDSTVHRTGAMPMLFWKSIEEAKNQGQEKFDLGRSDPDNTGLAAFKKHLGADSSKLTYLRLASNHTVPVGYPGTKIMSRIFARMPGALAQVAGSVLYRHMG